MGVGTWLTIVLLLFAAIIWPNSQAQGVSVAPRRVVGLEVGLGAFRHCTFHVTHLGDGQPDLAESILLDNQSPHTAWTIYTYNVSRSQSFPSSRLCNVHLLVLANGGAEGAGAKQIHVSDANAGVESTFYIIITTLKAKAEQILPLLVPNYRHISVNMFLVQVNLENDVTEASSGTVLCPACSESTTLQEMQIFRDNGGATTDVDQPEQVQLYLRKMNRNRRHFRGRCVQVIRPQAILGEECRVMDYFYFKSVRTPKPRRWMCNAVDKLVTEVVDWLNGSLVVSGGRWDKGKAKDCAATLITRRSDLDFDPGWQFVPYLVNSFPLRMMYCDYDLKRATDNGEWINPFAWRAWLFIVILLTMGVMVAHLGLREEEKEKTFKLQLKLRQDEGVGQLGLGLFRTFALIARQGRAKSVRQVLALGLVACVLTGIYEVHLTSIALAPNPPRVYSSLRELLEAGYKVVYGQQPNANASVSPIGASYRSYYRQEGISPELMHSSYTLVKGQFRIKWETTPNLCMWVSGSNSVAAQMLTTLQTLNPKAYCHSFRLGTSAIRSWTTFFDLYPDELRRGLMTAVEAGLLEMWYSLIETWYAQQNGRLEGISRQRGDPIHGDRSPRPIGMDAKIMIVIPVCGCVSAAGGLILLLLECMHHVISIRRSHNQILT